MANEERQILQPDDDTFHPRGGTVGRNNVFRMFYIYPDGSTRERIYLNVDDKRQREAIICTHFLQFCATHVIRDDIGINVLGRDDPWDFRLELSTGKVINLEIVSIADNELQHRATSHQARWEESKFLRRIRIRDLQKRAAEFPDSGLQALCESELAKGLGLDDEIENPLFDPTPEPTRIFLSRSEPLHRELPDIVLAAIKSKVNKPHLGKENTVLVIDNRTSVERISTFMAAFQALEGKLVDAFLQIWLYTGYCSDWDGSNGEYTMIHVAGDLDRLATRTQSPR